MAGERTYLADCNGGYSLDEDYEFLSSLDQYELAMIEQPLCPTTGGNAGERARQITTKQQQQIYPFSATQRTRTHAPFL